MKSPALWGTEARIDKLFGAHANRVASSHGLRVPLSLARPLHGCVPQYYGPIHKAFLALDSSGQAALAKDLLTTIASFNTATDGSMHVPSAYAEIVIEKH